MSDKNKDRLDMAYVNSLPQPLWDRGYPVINIDVQSGLYHIDVCGMVEVRSIDKCFSMLDAFGKSHFVGDFELDSSLWDERTCPPNPEASAAAKPSDV